MFDAFTAVSNAGKSMRNKNRRDGGSSRQKEGEEASVAAGVGSLVAAEALCSESEFVSEYSEAEEELVGAGTGVTSIANTLPNAVRPLNTFCSSIHAPFNR